MKQAKQDSRMIDADGLRRFGHLEQAAREYCRLAGIEADKLFDHGAAEFGEGPGFYKSMICHSPRWLFVARDLHHYEKRKQSEKLMEEALHSTRAQETETA